MSELHRRDVLKMLLAAGMVPLAGCGSIFNADPDAAFRASDELPEPVAVFAKRWGSDQFARGSTSFIRPNGSPADRSVLAAAVSPLFFAGEHTSIDAPNTLHGAWASGVRAAQEVIGSRKDSSVIVIGAGMAGLGAARTLADAGAEVTILEANDRVGGRIGTVFGNFPVPVEIGADVLTGGTSNPLYALVQQFGMATRPRSAGPTFAVRNLGGQRLSDFEIGQATTKAATVTSSIVGTRAALAFDRSMVESIDEVELALGVQSYEEQLLDYSYHLQLEQNSGADVNELSTRSFDEGIKLTGDSLELVDGMQVLCAKLSSGLNLALSTPVRRIDWKKSPVRIETAGDTYTASAVIVTLPLGVLAGRGVAFSPDLPDDKLASFTRVGAGVIDRLVMQFPERFWDNDADVLSYLGGQKGEWAWFDTLHKQTGLPILSARLAGLVGRRFEVLNDTQLVASAMTALRTMYQVL